MKPLSPSRRQFLKLAGAVAGARAFGPGIGFGEPEPLVEGEYQTAESKADYTLHIGDSYIHDVLGARSVGITPILLDRLHRFAYRVASCGAGRHDGHVGAFRAYGDGDLA